jgi:Na+/H+ antiporter NhaA
VRNNNTTIDTIVSIVVLSLAYTTLFNTMQEKTCVVAIVMLWHMTVENVQCMGMVGWCGGLGMGVRLNK